MRDFALQVYDEDLNLVDEFILDLVTAPSGLGFAQKVTVVTSGVVDYIVNQQIDRKDIKLTVNFFEPDSYGKVEKLRTWLGQYLNYEKYRMVLQYTNDYKQKWINIYVKEFTATEIDTRINQVPLVLRPLSPFYDKLTKSILITLSKTNKSYPYGYPYTYGGGSYSNNSLENTFLGDIPLCVVLKGEIVNPQVSLRDDNGEIYAAIAFTGFTLLKGAELVIDAIAGKITYRAPDSEKTIDFYNQIDKLHDTFLYAKHGKSVIVPNLESDDPNNKPACIIKWIQYVV